ncbi:MAG: ParA family protein [Ancalomicrobiaceae bacterium]|nr:ParA family protein [Ancalomicrobiaceae bacterium]
MLVLTFVGKGGSGKSSTAINTAVLAMLGGYRVGVVDTDPQASVQLWQAYRGQKDIPLQMCRPAEVRELVDQARRSQFDLVVIDTPPQMDRSTAVTMALADLVCVMTRPGAFDLSVTLSRTRLAERQGVNHAVIINLAPPVRNGVDAPLVADLRDALKINEAACWHGQLTSRVAVPAALANGQGIAEFAPEGLAAAEARRLWAALERRFEEKLHAIEA